MKKACSLTGNSPKKGIRASIRATSDQMRVMSAPDWNSFTYYLLIL